MWARPTLHIDTTDMKKGNKSFKDKKFVTLATFTNTVSQLLQICSHNFVIPISRVTLVSAERSYIHASAAVRPEFQLTGTADKILYTSCSALQSIRYRFSTGNTKRIDILYNAEYKNYSKFAN